MERKTIGQEFCSHPFSLHPLAQTKAPDPMSLNIISIPRSFIKCFHATYPAFLASSDSPLQSPLCFAVVHIKCAQHDQQPFGPFHFFLSSSNLSNTSPQESLIIQPRYQWFSPTCYSTPNPGSPPQHGREKISITKTIQCVTKYL